MGMLAQFESWCEDCEDGIVPGEEIEYDDDTGNWVHSSCPIAQILKQGKADYDARPRCSRCCDLIVNGKCRSCDS